MSTISEGALIFTFPNNWDATKFDAWAFYRNQFQKVCGGTKAVDILAITPQRDLWSIEVKDYRRNRRTKVIDLADEVAQKTRDTLAAIVAASCNANDAGEKQFAVNALRCSRIRVAVHVEQPLRPSRLFPRPINPASIAMRLRQLVKPIDPHPLVVDSQSQLLDWSTR